LSKSPLYKSPPFDPSNIGGLDRDYSTLPRYCYTVAEWQFGIGTVMNLWTVATVTYVEPLAGKKILQD
jgi:hypothetical protein